MHTYIGLKTYSGPSTNTGMQKSTYGVSVDARPGRIANCAWCPGISERARGVRTQAWKPAPRNCGCYYCILPSWSLAVRKRRSLPHNRPRIYCLFLSSWREGCEATGFTPMSSATATTRRRPRASKLNVRIHADAVPRPVQPAVRPLQYSRYLFRLSAPAWMPGLLIAVPGAAPWCFHETLRSRLDCQPRLPRRCADTLRDTHPGVQAPRTRAVRGCWLACANCARRGPPCAKRARPAAGIYSPTYVHGYSGRSWMDRLRVLPSPPPQRGPDLLLLAFILPDKARDEAPSYLRRRERPEAYRRKSAAT
ncbi:hypothetical protein BV25DRAFT_1832906 [Artomyces pyxidatus]|uniref:Uncharacterized protein n=1 Tax=Artomyces pyxidatus TaxID=48021 RepID=A0ACB8SI71_9AGAM|nr:hypothetical protein BV25DRAFT_1832906 [Artomyces pyxidatus]